MKAPNKNVPIYVYYVTIEKQKSSTAASSKYDMGEIVNAFTKVLQFTISQELTERKIDNTAADKIIWLDDFKDLENGNYNLIFKSAKYNHVRNEIDTVNMTPLGQRKRPQDGDEEKTHLCIRLADGQMRFLAIHESNHYGISIKGIVDYLNSQFEKLNEQDEQEAFYGTVKNCGKGLDMSGTSNMGGIVGLNYGNIDGCTNNQEKKEITKQFDFHSLRKTHASMLNELGIDQKYIQTRLGHSDIDITVKVYESVTDLMRIRGRNALNNMFSNN